MSFPADFLPTHRRVNVTLLEPTIIVERGENVEDWSEPTQTVLDGCIAYPGAVDSDWERASALGIDFTACIPAEHALPAGNFRAQIQFEPGVFTLTGDIKRWVYGQRFDANVIELTRRRDGV